MTSEKKNHGKHRSCLRAVKFRLWILDGIVDSRVNLEYGQVDFFPKFQVLKKGEKSQKTKIHFECHPGMPRVGVDDGGFTSGCLYTL